MRNVNYLFQATWGVFLRILRIRQRSRRFADVVWATVLMKINAGEMQAVAMMVLKHPLVGPPLVGPREQTHGFGGASAGVRSHTSVLTTRSSKSRVSNA